MDRPASSADSRRIQARRKDRPVSMVSTSPLGAARWFAGCLLWALSAVLVPATGKADDRGNLAAPSAKFDRRPLLSPVRVDTSKVWPRWAVSAEAIVLGRSGSGNRSLVSLVPGNVYWFTPSGPNTANVAGVEALNSNQLGQGLAAGPKLGLAYRDPAGWGAELQYFNVLGLGAVKATQSPGQWLVMRAPGTFWQTQDYAYQSMVWQDDTRLHSLEANASLTLSPRITLLAGVRWLQLRDELQGTLSPDDRGEPVWKYSIALFNIPSTLNDAVPIPGSPVVVNPPFWSTSTRNNLYGVQIGARSTLWEFGRVSVDGTIKAGVYDNRATQTTLISMRKQLYPAQSATDAAAFVGEASLVAKYQLGDGVALKLGYSALWLSGVALAPAQIQQITTTPSGVAALGVDCRSTTLLQGVTFGVEYAF
jgi:hypothetical protein